MAVTITDGSTTVTLPDDILWADRHNWSPVQQTLSISITGAAIVDSGQRVNGRPITLQGDENHSWIPYADVDQLRIWADEAGKVLTLNYHGMTFDVIFRHQDAAPLDMFPVVDYSAPDAQDFFYGTVKFTEI